MGLFDDERQTGEGAPSLYDVVKAMIAAVVVILVLGLVLLALGVEPSWSFVIGLGLVAPVVLVALFLTVIRSRRGA